MPKHIAELSVIENNIYEELAERLNQSLGRSIDTRLTTDIRTFALAFTRQLAAMAHRTEMTMAYTCHSCQRTTAKAAVQQPSLRLRYYTNHT